MAPHISIENATEHRIGVILPDDIFMILPPGETATSTLFGRYIVQNGLLPPSTIAVIEFETGTVTFVVETPEVSILYLQVGCQPVNPFMSILIDLPHSDKKCPESNPDLFVLSLAFTLNTQQSHAHGAGLYDVLVLRRCPLYVLVSCPFVVCFELEHQQTLFFAHGEQRSRVVNKQS